MRKKSWMFYKEILYILKMVIRTARIFRTVEELNYFAEVLEK